LDVDLSEFRNEKRSDADILADDQFDSDELDNLDESFGSLDEPTPEDGDNVTLDLPDAESDLGPVPDFDMDDLDAGFAADELGATDDLDEPEELLDPVPAPAEAAEDESWHDFSMDDLEPMEFLDTGDEISAPKTASAPPASPAAKKKNDDFSMDDDAPLELGNFDDDLEMGSLDGLGDFPQDPAPETDPGFDEDFLPPPELSDEKAFAASKAEKKASQKVAAAPRPAKAPRTKVAQSGGSLDKTALVLSLITLSLLVVTLMVLLFLNMIRPPQMPQITPEVMQWQSLTPLAASDSPSLVPTEIDLGDETTWPVFRASTVAEVPAALMGPRIALQLRPGETVADATRRFGAPDRVEGELLFW